MPGGVGKMTIAMLMENTVSAAEKAAAMTSETDDPERMLSSTNTSAGRWRRTRC